MLPRGITLGKRMLKLHKQQGKANAGPLQAPVQASINTLFNNYHALIA